jgi:signal transduction histidine kinase
MRLITMDDSMRSPPGAREPQGSAPTHERIEIIDAEGRVRLATGDPADPPPGGFWLACWNQAQRAHARQALDAAWAGRRAHFVAPRTDGDTPCWDVGLGPLRDACGAIDAVVAVSRRIGDRDRREDSPETGEAFLGSDLRQLAQAAAEERAHAQALQRKLGRVSASHRQVREESIGLHDRLLQADGDAALGARRERALQHQLDLATVARRSAEQASRQAQKGAAMGQLVAGIAHDFNNMLQVVQMTLDMMALQSESDPHQMRLLARSQEAVGHAVDLARRLLAFGREHPYHAEALDLGQVVADMLPLIEHGLGPRMALALPPAGDALPIRSDRHSIGQALMNLCVNARDACQGHGRIDIALGMEDVPAERDGALHRAGGRYAYVEVRDNGCGMDAATRARIFDPFFTTKPEGVGTGLGLAQVSGLMRQSEGFATVQSEPGQGACVRLYFPALQA